MALYNHISDNNLKRDLHQLAAEQNPRMGHEEIESRAKEVEKKMLKVFSVNEFQDNQAKDRLHGEFAWRDLIKLYHQRTMVFLASHDLKENGYFEDFNGYLYVTECSSGNFGSEILRADAENSIGRGNSYLDLLDMGKHMHSWLKEKGLDDIINVNVREWAVYFGVNYVGIEAAIENEGLDSLKERFEENLKVGAQERTHVQSLEEKKAESSEPQRGGKRTPPGQGTGWRGALVE